MSYVVPKKLDDALGYFRKNGYKRLALKDANHNIVLPYNSMQDGELDGKVREIKTYFNDASFQSGIYYVSGQKSPRSAQGFEIPVEKSSTYALRGNGNPYAVYNSLYNQGQQPSNLVEENNMLKARLAEIEANLADDYEDQDPLMNLLEEHGPQLLEMGKMLIENMINKNKPKPSFNPLPKKKITISAIRSMPDCKAKQQLVNSVLAKYPHLAGKI
jgi:hypothetical protein